jgi:hypothetical protein
MFLANKLVSTSMIPATVLLSAILGGCVFHVARGTFPEQGGHRLPFIDAKFECVDERTGFQRVKIYEVKGQKFGNDWYQYHVTGSTSPLVPNHFAPFRLDNDSFLLVGTRGDLQAIYVAQFLPNSHWAFLARYTPTFIESIAKGESMEANTSAFPTPQYQFTRLLGTQQDIVRFFRRLTENYSAAEPMLVCRIFPLN